MMTSRQQMLIRESFAAARELADPLAQLFYGRLFQISPEVRPLFRSDMKAQGKKLMDTLELVVTSVDNLDPLRPQLRELGARHVGYGVEPHQYETVSAALIWAIGQASGLTAEARDAWRVLLDEISAEMLSGSPANDTAHGRSR
jgi:nitric oxide dioxygenase